MHKANVYIKQQNEEIYDPSDSEGDMAVSARQPV